MRATSIGAAAYRERWAAQSGLIFRQQKGARVSSSLPLDALRGNADLAVAKFAQLSNLASFGYDHASVDWVDGYLSRMHEAPSITDDVRHGLVNVVGSFLGECIIRNYGGAWQELDGRLAVVLSEENAVFPFAKIQKQLENGREDSILSLFEVIPIVFDRRELQAAVSPSPQEEPVPRKRPWWRLW